jgi:hypothetical protein
MPVLAVLLAAAAPSAPATACLHTSAERDLPVTLSGRLESHVYPGPPNYESIRGGDRAEGAYILVLDRPICIDDGGEFGNARAPFRRVHIYTARDALQPRLQAAVGHRIRISGQGFAAWTAHHRAPLVVEVRALGRIGR